jgi:hypothetical protein
MLTVHASRDPLWFLPATQFVLRAPQALRRGFAANRCAIASNNTLVHLLGTAS